MFLFEHILQLYLYSSLPNISKGVVSSLASRPDVNRILMYCSRRDIHVESVSWEAADKRRNETDRFRSFS